jgi:hypothetical protein
MIEKTKVIGFFGGPGSGKSTTAAKLFSEMKERNFDVELVSEFAKDLIWAERNKEFGNQLYVGVSQYHRLWNLNGKVEYIITDSPLLLNYTYYQDPPDFLMDMLRYMYNEFENINYFIHRTKKFNPKGRNQNLEESQVIDGKILSMLNDLAISYNTIESHDTDRVMKALYDIHPDDEHSILNSNSIGACKGH